MNSKYRLKFVFLRGRERVCEVIGPLEFNANEVTAKGDDVIQTEQAVERLTGLRLHIEQVPVHASK